MKRDFGRPRAADAVWRTLGAGAAFTLSLLLSACVDRSADEVLPIGREADTAAWLAIVEDLADDGMEGRDTGSPGYDRAAAYVADRFARAGLKPAGEDGTFFQNIAFREVSVPSDGASFDIVRSDGTTRSLRFLHEVSVSPSEGMATALDAPLLFVGYCNAVDMAEIANRAVVCFGTRRTGMTSAASRAAAAAAGGAAAIITVDDPGFTIEPPRWPVAYARQLYFADAPPPAPGPAATGPVQIRLSADVFAELIAGADQDPAAILAAGSASEPLPVFEIPARIVAQMNVEARSYASANVLGILPGTDPALAGEVVMVDAHLDGYGYGEPVDGDALYNGALDDAAYVATLIRLAERRAGEGFRRPVLFAAFTGEEKGLLGSRWLADHPTPAAPPPVAVVNLDQLRPLYPLTILTTLGLEDSTLGLDVRAIAEPMGLVVRADSEPERNLIRRSDHWPFMQKGVPAVSFIFGYDPGTEAERRYREWYETRYHRPQDDMTTPFDLGGAGDFNRFFYDLTARIANADAAPQWAPQSPLRPQAE